jgi:hypothetical protein
MNEKKARKILGRSIVVSDLTYENNGLKPSSDLGHVNWLYTYYQTVTIDGELNPDRLEAIAWWIRNKYKA